MDSHERYRAFLREQRHPVPHSSIPQKKRQHHLSLLAGITVLCLLLLVLGGLYFLSRTNHSQMPIKKPITKIVSPVKDAKPQTFGLSYHLSSDKHSLQFNLNNITGVTHITYALTYLVTNDERKGVVGDINAPAGQSTIASPAIPFGTCKNNMCTYDTNVHAAQLILTITKTSGEKFQVTEQVRI